MTSGGWWTSVGESEFPWERDALEFVRGGLPAHEPYRAWSNLEFVAEDGAVYEVDLLVVTPKGFFLVEIKSRPGRVSGDAGTWVWTHEGRTYPRDNPLLLANRKAKKLKSLLSRQDGFKKDRKLPFLQVLVFLSAPGVEVALDEHARHWVCVRDRKGPDAAPQPDTPEGILHALQTFDPGQYPNSPRQRLDRVDAKAISRAMEQAGIRPSQRVRQVRDYRLGRLLYEGPGYQDFEATHVSLANVHRRIRIYTVARTTDPALRQTIARAARREFEILEGIQHPGILRAVDYTEHELGPALFFEVPKDAPRLDQFLAEHGDRLGVDQRLAILRQLAEALKYAHGRRLCHRALCPQSVLVTDSDPARPVLRIFNWQTALREIQGSSGHAALTRTGTAHMEDLIEDASSVYLAPETLTAPESAGEALDIFSLGAIAYRLFAGRPPAANPIELVTRLREGRGLVLEDRVDGAPRSLREMIRLATIPDVMSRLESIESADGFLTYLEAVEDELTAPEESAVKSPAEAGAGDLLPGNFLVLKRIGAGATAYVFLVDGPKAPRVLKVARGPEQDARLRDEAAVLEKLRHHRIVAFHSEAKVGERAGILMGLAGEETLRQRLRQDGRLTIELLQRFGDDLFEVVKHLEECDVPHRDLKPDNLGIAKVGRDNQPHLVLFDFSLSKAPATEIRVGTLDYLDPSLVDRKPRRWDVYAEHFSLATTLYEMAAGVLPKWGGGGDPAALPDEATVESDLFDAEVREPLTAFFRKALRRKVSERFGNIQEMHEAWRRVFARTTPPGPEPDEGTGERPDLDPALAAAVADTPLVTIPFSTRAQNALARASAATVRDLLRIRPFSVRSMRGVGAKTRDELLHAIRLLAEKFPALVGAPPDQPEPEPPPEAPESAAVERIARRLIPERGRRADVTVAKVLRSFLGLGEGEPAKAAVPDWPTQSEVAGVFSITRARVGQIVKDARTGWTSAGALTQVREAIAKALAALAGAATGEEVEQAVLTACGTAEPLERARVFAHAVARAAIEAEHGMKQPRWVERRVRTRFVLALEDPDGQATAAYVDRLGPVADALAVEDPLPSPATVEERLRKVPPPPANAPLPHERLVRLAAAASLKAAVSPRLELYPRGMAASRALRLAGGAIAGVKELTVEEVRSRVAARYPEAERLPDRPDLDFLLSEAGLEIVWDHEKMLYRAPPRDYSGISSRTSSLERRSTVLARTISVSPEVVEARLFEERLERAARDGAFLVLKVAPAQFAATTDEITRRFGVRAVSLEALLLDRMKAEAATLRADWGVVLRADAAPAGSEDARRLAQLVARAMPRVEEAVCAEAGTVLLLHTGPLARYGQMELLDRLRERVSVGGRGAGLSLRGLWVLIAGDEQQELPVLDGKAVPVVTRAEWASVPRSWLENRHRGDGRRDAGEAEGKREA